MSATTRPDIAVRVAAFAAGAFVLAVFLKNAWVSDDAYIIFRSVEQFVSGNGPRWNPHERVQVFTSPLWFGVLSVFRLFSADVFANAIAVSGLCVAATLVVIRRTLGRNGVFLVVLAALLASNGFFDYTSSGLENPLCYLVMSLYLMWYLRLFGDAGGGDGGDERRGLLRRVLMAAGWLLLCRVDLIVLIALPTLHAVQRHRALFIRSHLIRDIAVALAPLFAWSAFALVYYGTPVPNPAYAKLWTGIAQTDLWRQGSLYVWVTVLLDPVTIVGVLGGGILMASRGRPGLRALGLGVLINLVYVVHVGGDFMLGRFFSHSYLIVVVSLGVWSAGRWETSWRPFAVAGAMLVAYWFAFPHTPVPGAAVHEGALPHLHGVADERRVYQLTTIAEWRKRDDMRVFPDIKWARDGDALRQTPVCCSIAWSVGAYGYYAGTDKRIVDLFALCDPLLARLPVGDREWRIGHFRRSVPPQYLECVNSGENRFEEGELHDYYEAVRLVTQSDALWSWRRFKAIWVINQPWGTIEAPRNSGS